MHSSVIVSFFFFTAPAPPEIYTLSLHDALPIYLPGTQVAAFLNRPYTGTPPDFEIRWSPISIFPSSDRKSTRLNSSHQIISYAVFCLKKKKTKNKLYHVHIDINLIIIMPSFADV